jgi:hypothetical protein
MNLKNLRRRGSWLLQPGDRSGNLACMRFRTTAVPVALALAALLALSACGGRRLDHNLARNLIVGMHPGAQPDALRKGDVSVVDVHQSSATEAVAETRMLTAFRFEKDGGVWRVREVRFGHGQWESVENVGRALDQVKAEETRGMLDRLAQAVAKYRDANRSLPEFGDFIGLADRLSPAYLTPLIRLDAWQRPFEASMTASGDIQVRSAGADGVMGTADDLALP